jgi:hypothetical protein
LYVDGVNKKPSSLNVSGDSNQGLGASAQLLGRHSIWHPSKDRNAKSTNHELAQVLKEVAVNNEVAVAISNSRLAGDGYMLEFWYGHQNLSMSVSLSVEAPLP